MLRISLVVAGVSGALAVTMAAIAAHAPAGARVELLTVAWQIALPHAAAIIGVALAAERMAGLQARYLKAATILLILGTILFPGSLYLSAFGGPGQAAPLGGLCLILGWIVLVFAATRGDA